MDDTCLLKDETAKKIGLRSWEMKAAIGLIVVSACWGGYALGAWHAGARVVKIERAYHDASDARLQTLNLCLAVQGRAVTQAADATEGARNAAEVAAAAASTAAQAALAAKK